MIGYIFAFPGNCFMYPTPPLWLIETKNYWEHVSLRMVNGGFLPERQHPRKSNNALLPLKINTFTTIGELIRYLPEEHSIRI